MIDTTTISKINTQNPNYQYPCEPTHQFHIEISGVLTEAFVGEISTEQAEMFQGYSPADVQRKVFSPSSSDEFFGLQSDIPEWAREIEDHDFWGIDILKPFKITVTDDDGNVMYLNEGPLYRTNDDHKDYDYAGPYLYAKDTCQGSHRYIVKSLKPFDPLLYTLGCVDVVDTRICTNLKYDGQFMDIESGHWPWGAPEARETKIIYH